MREEMRDKQLRRFEGKSVEMRCFRCAEWDIISLSAKMNPNATNAENRDIWLWNARKNTRIN